MATPLIVYSSTSASQSVGPITSTKVRVVTGGNPVFFNVGNVLVAASAANSAIIASNSTRYINMQGLNNYIAFLGNVGQATVTVETIGTVSAITLPKYDAGGNIVMRTA
jgi:hypothetical protein